jgi:hypothetical protein
MMNFFCSTGVWTQGLTIIRQALLLLEPLHQPFLGMFFFKIGSQGLFAWGWLWTAILLISASWVARITRVSYQCWHEFFFFGGTGVCTQCLCLLRSHLTIWVTFPVLFSFFHFSYFSGRDSHSAWICSVHVLPTYVSHLAATTPALLIEMRSHHFLAFWVRLSEMGVSLLSRVDRELQSSSQVAEITG